MSSPRAVAAYLELGAKRAFAGAIDWPGWCRSGRDEDAALLAMLEYGPRYAAALGEAEHRVAGPKDWAAVEVVERLAGTATTDFGAPAVPPAADGNPLTARDARRQAAILRACWEAFDRAAEAAEGAILRGGPRGGGREVPAMVDHVREADRAYLSRLGGATGGADDPGDEMEAIREGLVETFLTRARGNPPPRPRRSGTLWTPRYAVRRSAWHALDHAWEIQDRSAVVP